MRTHLIAIAHVIALVTNAQFAPPGATWTYDQGDSVYTMSSVGDTLIEGHSCAVIHGSYFSGCWQSHAYTYQSGDTVFWSDDLYLPEFFELYRWNATVGESWNAWVNGPVTLTYTVLSTGMTTVNGQALRTLSVQATDTQEQWAQSSGTLIESIGDTLFLFPWLAAFCDAIPPWPLRCYTDDNLGTFMRPGVTECDVITGLPSTEAEHLPSYFPSVVAAGVPIMIPGSNSLVANLQLFDISGRMVGMTSLTSGNAELIFEHPGCYVLRWETGGIPNSQRIIVQ